jgi:hypothetical protein
MSFPISDFRLPMRFVRLAWHRQSEDGATMARFVRYHSNANTGSAGVLARTERAARTLVCSLVTLDRPVMRSGPFAVADGSTTRRSVLCLNRTTLPSFLRANVLTARHRFARLS